MYRFFVFSFCVFFSIHLPAEKIELSGNWGVKLDSQAIGINENWQKCEYKDSINLPGALHTRGYGFDITPHTKWYSGSLSALWHYHPMYEKYRKPGNIKIFDFLQPKKQYIGVAWYKRTFDLPVDQNKKEYFIYLERVHWESTLYINNKKIGSNKGLGTAHEYNITDFVRSGQNEIVLRIDNSSVVDLGRIPHSISEQTMAAWNGIIGDMEIRTKDKIWIDQLQIFPDYEKKQAILKLKIANRLNKSEELILHLEVKNYNSQRTFPEKHLVINYTINADSVTPIEIVYPFSKNVQSWNEFNPSLYKINVSLKSANANDHITERFGFRDLSLNGRRFALNGRTISVRGNINCGEFPVDGLPEMSVEWWKNIFKIHKEWGHNMVRFHSWCPPNAAFIAADEVGIYLQPEVSEWGVIVTPEQEQFIAEENDRMIAQYGNHPSWLFIAMGNELRSDPKIMERFITKNKSDQRRFVSGKTNGRPLLDSFDFASSYGINGQRVRHHMGWPPLPETNLLFHIQPNTAYDYSEAVKEYPKPFLAHEIGQYCVFPDYEHELPKYTGTLRATVLDIQKDQLEERGMANQSGLFSEATGKWQIELLKSEYEANLRTKEMGGFHALSLQDFPGQSHAPVGVLDAFWEAKKHITSEVFRQFCDETVLLARIPALILQQNDTFQAKIELYNFAEKPIYRKHVSYTITDEKNNIIMKGIFNKKDYANQQSNIPVGTISLKLQGMKAPAKYSLKLKMDKTTIENKYNFWVYPDNIPFDNGTVKIVRDFDEQTIQYLENGHNVLWLTDQSKLKGDLPTSFASIYWTAFGLNDGESMTNSILCDPGHPLFRNFPTDMHSNWQWWDILRYSVPMILDEFGAKAAFPKSYKPVLQAIDSWKVNRKLALLAECRYAKGKLMISGIDFTKNIDKRVASRQLYSSLISYMSSNDFNPQTLLDKETILSVYGVPENNLLNIKAKVISTNKFNTLMDSWLIDGNKNTVWKADGKKGSITIDLKNTVQIKGLTFMLPEKEIHQYTFYISDDGVNWELISNEPSQPVGDKQIVLFNKAFSKQYIRINFEGFFPSVSELDFIYADALPIEG